MLYKEKNYNITLTYRCKNCGAVEFINPEIKPPHQIEVGPNQIQIRPEFMAFAIEGGSPVPLDSPPLTHKDRKSVV